MLSRPLCRWLDQLSELPDMPNVDNLYSRRTAIGQARLANLRRYFEQMMALGPRVLLVSEAPGYLTSGRTGLPFCSEVTLLRGVPTFGLFGPDNGYQRIFDGRPSAAPSGTVVWRVLSELDELPLIWSAFPLHPHQPGNLLSNRAPTTHEVQTVGRPILQSLLAITNISTIIAVGNVGARCLADMGIPAPKVRHPSHGGAVLFRDQLRQLLD